MGALQKKPHNHTILKLIYHSGYKGTLWCQFGGDKKIAYVFRAQQGSQFRDSRNL